METTFLERLTDHIQSPELVLPLERAHEAPHFWPKFEEHLNFQDGHSPWHWRRVGGNKGMRDSELEQAYQFNETLRRACEPFGSRIAWCRKDEVWLGVSHVKYYGLATTNERITEWIVNLPGCNSHPDGFEYVLIRLFRFKMQNECGHGGPGYFEPDHGNQEEGHQTSWALLKEPDEVPLSHSYRPLGSPNEQLSRECKVSFEDLRAELGRVASAGMVRTANFGQLRALLEPPHSEESVGTCDGFLEEVATWLTEEGEESKESDEVYYSYKYSQ